MVDEVAGAIADDVRREILLMLRDEALSAGQIADRFAISRPAVSRHLRVLRGAGLVRDTADGRRRVYQLVTEPLDALETEVYRTRRERRTAAGHHRSEEKSA
jgi:DNA-binding transcriptional ArsR family regulator